MKHDPSNDVDWLLNRLEPLRRGYAVVLSMQDDRYARMVKYRGKKQNQLVTLTPGSLYGFAPDSVQVAIIGSGAAIVFPARSEKVADLILAGMPARLAKLLMEKLHRLYQES